MLLTLTIDGPDDEEEEGEEGEEVEVEVEGVKRGMAAREIKYVPLRFVLINLSQYASDVVVRGYAVGLTPAQLKM